MQTALPSPGFVFRGTSLAAPFADHMTRYVSGVSLVAPDSCHVLRGNAALTMTACEHVASGQDDSPWWSVTTSYLTALFFAVHGEALGNTKYVWVIKEAEIEVDCII